MENLPRKLTLYSQTTKSMDKFYEAVEVMEQAGIEVDANDTICRQVSNRDIELRKFATQFDKIVFVSGTKSSNGKVLYNVCKETNPNTYFVSSPKEVQPEWFSANNSVGICGATSTPLWLMEEVKSILEEI
jgi:4-hydroxy-3-methylbut-2-enyl diphosphate reductase